MPTITGRRPAKFSTRAKAPLPTGIEINFSCTNFHSYNIRKPKLASQFQIFVFWGIIFVEDFLCEKRCLYFLEKLKRLDQVVSVLKIMKSEILRP